MKTENAALHEELIQEILARLPVKSLLRFRCVCKIWYSVISSPRFCNNLHQMRPSVLICENSHNFSTITIESLLTSKNKKLTPLALPWETEIDSSSNRNYFIGSCNGLVCVDFKCITNPDRSDLILWNPSMRKFRRLARFGGYQVRDVGEYFSYLWFGYDESIHDYKLVWLMSHPPFPAPSKIELHVFTLKSNTWRRPFIDEVELTGMNLSKVNDMSNPKTLGFLSSGAIHWTTYYSSPMDGFTVGILAFDLATEKFRVLLFPHVPFDTMIGSVLGRCPCDNEDNEEMSLWMVKKHAMAKLISWCTLRTDTGSRYFKYYPIIFSKEESKEILAVFDIVCDKHIWYNGGDKIVKLRIEGGEKVRLQETLLCVPRVQNGYTQCKTNIVLHMEESLVSPN